MILNGYSRGTKGVKRCERKLPEETRVYRKMKMPGREVIRSQGRKVVRVMRSEGRSEERASRERK